MIRDSVIAMTTIDLFLIAMVVVLTITILRLRRVSPGKSAGLASHLTIVGLGLIGLLFLTDLLSMHALPRIVGPAQAELVTNAVHLELKWIVIAISTSLICLGFVLSSMDQKRSIGMLETSEERFRSIVQDQLDMIVRWKGDGIRTWVNEPYCKAFGISRDEAIGTSFFPLLANVESLKAQRDSLTPEAPAYTIHHELNQPNGSTVLQEWVSRGVFDASGNLIEVQSIGRDVTNQVQMERALQESEARFKGFVENTSDFVWETDLSFRYVYSNRQVKQLLGYEREEILNRSLTEFMHPDAVDEIKSGLVPLRDEQRGWQQWLMKFRHSNGSIRYVESSASPVFDAHKAIIGYRGIDRDRTFQTLLTQLSSQLVECDAAEIDAALLSSFQSVAESYGVERVSFWDLTDNAAVRSHSWSGNGVPNHHGSTATEVEGPNVNAALRAGKLYMFESLRDLPKDAPEQIYFRRHDVKSVLIVPLILDEKALGIISFATVTEERTWPEKTTMELQLLSDKIAASYHHALGELLSRRHQKDLAQSEELTKVGSYAFYPDLAAGPFPEGWHARFSDELLRQLEADEDTASYELFLSRIHENDRQRVESAFEKLVNQGNHFQEQFRVVNPGGSTIRVQSRAELELDRRGAITRIVGSNRDITEQVGRETALVAALEENERLRSRLEEENVQLREEIQSFTEFEQIIGESNALRTSLNLAARAAPTDSTILILGETGTGKELVARAIHKLSERRDKRLVSVNCTALPLNLIESELFGHERGAFTGASGRRAGRFEAADGGTLFLDEIGDLPLELQGKLLRVLEDGGFERLGGNETIRPDVRLVTATNRNLEAAVRAGEFRADLYYRINIVPIELPPLRKRKEDIPLLAQHFLEKHRERLGKSVSAISTRMIEFLLNRDWPGNVRELEHYVERSLISATGKVLSIGEQYDREDPLPGESKLFRPAELKSVEREHIMQVLADTNWVIDGTRGAAAVLGLAPSTLRSRMKKLGIARRA